MPKSRRHLSRRGQKKRRKKPAHLSDLAEFLDGIVTRVRRPSSPHKILYHYTDWPGFKGILSSRAFKSTAHDCTNDEAELKSADDIVLEVAKSYQRKAIGVAADVFEVFVANYRDTIVTNLRTMYLACFSSVRDNASMWQMYGKAGKGVCIGLRILDEAPPESQRHVSFTTDVVYSVDALRNQLMEDFGSVYELLVRAKRTAGNRHEGLSSLYRIAAFAAIRAKSESWSYEAEVRHVTFSRQKHGIVPNERTTPSGKLTRDTFVLVRKEGRLLSLAEVIVGSNQDGEKARTDVVSILSVCGYAEGCPEYPRITQSDVIPSDPGAGGGTP